MRKIYFVALCALASCGSEAQQQTQTPVDSATTKTVDSIVIMQESGLQKKKLNPTVDTAKLKNSRAMRVLQKANGN